VDSTEDTGAAGPSPVEEAAKTPKALSDFKIGPIHLEKVPGSSLVYAIGALTNDSDSERYGVRIGLRLLDGRENELGSIQDYVPTLQPRGVWTFRALLTDRRAVAVKFDGVTEDN
jgi:hypothetical protein